MKVSVQRTRLGVVHRPRATEQVVLVVAGVEVRLQYAEALQLADALVDMVESAPPA